MLDEMRRSDERASQAKEVQLDLDRARASSAACHVVIQLQGSRDSYCYTALRGLILRLQEES